MNDERQSPRDPSPKKSVLELLDGALTQSIDDFSELLTAKMELAKLDAMELLASVAANLAIIFVALVGATCLFIALALYLGELFGQRSLGFLTVGLALLLVVAFLSVARPEWLRKKFLNVFWKAYGKKSSTQTRTNL